MHKERNTNHLNSCLEKGTSMQKRKEKKKIKDEKVIYLLDATEEAKVLWQ